MAPQCGCIRAVGWGLCKSLQLKVTRLSPLRTCNPNFANLLDIYDMGILNHIAYYWILYVKPNHHYNSVCVKLPAPPMPPGRRRRSMITAGTFGSGSSQVRFSWRHMDKLQLETKNPWLSLYSLLIEGVMGCYQFYPVLRNTMASSGGN